MPPKFRKRQVQKICEGCGQLGAKEVLLDDRGLQAGVFVFCDVCRPKLKYRTGDYVVRWYRIDSTLPPSRKPHRDVDLWTLPRWGEEGHSDDGNEGKRRAYGSSEEEEEDEDEGEGEGEDERNSNNSTNNSGGKDSTSTDFFAALKAAKDAGPMPAHIKPLKRLAIMALADFTLSGAREVAFHELRATLHACLHQPLLDQMFETNRLRDHFRRKRVEREQAVREAQKGDTVKAIEKHASEHASVEEHPEAKHTEFYGGGGDGEEGSDPLASTEVMAGRKDHWKQYSSRFLAQLRTFVWQDEPHVVDLSSAALGPRDLDLLCQTVAKQTIGDLSLKWNLLGAKNAGFLHSLMVVDNVHTMDLGWNKLHDDGAQVIAKALPRCSMLRDLDLTGNGITKVGIAHICRGMGEAPMILRLNLSFNPLGAEGAAALVNSGLGTAPLTHLGLRSCELGVTGAVALARGFRKNTTLKEMMIADNQITREGARQVARNLKLTPLALLRAFGCGDGDRTALHQRSDPTMVD
jgi:hypothetical protein